MSKAKSRPVIVVSEHRAVLFGYSEDTSGSTVHLTGARWAIRWGTTKGMHQLAETGPTKDSMIGARADVEVRNVIMVIEVTPEAVKAWEKWGVEEPKDTKDTNAKKGGK